MSYTFEEALERARDQRTGGVPSILVRQEAAKLANGKLVGLADAAALLRRGIEVGLAMRFNGNARGPLRRYTDAERLERKRDAAKRSRFRIARGKRVKPWKRRPELEGMIEAEYHREHMRLWRKERSGNVLNT